MSGLPDSQPVDAQVVTPQKQPSQQSMNNDTLHHELLCEILTDAVQMSWKDSPLWGTERLESFDDCRLPSHFEPIYKSYLSRVEPMLVPIRFSQVCKSWRKAAMGCSSVWAYIDVPIGGKEDQKRAEWYKKVVDTCIERSRAAPLNLSLSCACYHKIGDVEPNRDTVEYILEKLLNQQHRWRQAYFSFGDWNPSKAPKIELLDAPILEMFSICWRSSLPSARQVYIDSSHCPNLRSLHIGGLPHIETSDGKLSSVTELTYTEDSEYQHGRVPLLEIIQQVPNLESLKFLFFHGLYGHENLQFPPISLCQLHTLEFDTSRSSAFIISKLILPPLTRLICHAPINEHRTHSRIRMLLDTFRQPLPSVEYLDLIGRWVADDTLAPFIRRVPNLKSLRTIGSGSYVCLNSGFFAVLSINDTPSSYFQPRNASSILCPNLTELCLGKYKFFWHTECAVNSLYDMLEVRCKALDLVAFVECRIDDDNGHGIDQHFYVPFIDIRASVSVAHSIHEA